MQRKMLVLIFLNLYGALIATTGATGVNPTRGGAKDDVENVAERIVGGQITDIEKYPFMVSVQYRHDGHVCGGTYIAPRFVLSAAHCMVRATFGDRWVLENPRRFYVIAGATYVHLPSWGSIQMELIDRLLPHREFKFSTMRNDIGLFRLQKPLRVTKYVKYVTLPQMYDANIFMDHKSHCCTAIGWGRHVPDSNEGVGTYLRHVQVPLIPPESCRVASRLHAESQLCAGFSEGGRDSCQGDSGGPLVCSEIQIGIVSWGIGCARPDSPGVYSRVDYFLEWMNRTVTKNDASKSPFYGVIIFISLLVLCM